jgi:hypothetical protein
MDASSREIERQKLDKEIQHASEVLRMLKTRRNSLAPISRLPTEILARIFTTIAHSYLDNFGYRELSWIYSVTAVCGHWRAIALECTSLWCFISVECQNWTEVMLERSKMAPLIVKAKLDDDPLDISSEGDTVRLALQHISRIKELRLVTSKDNIEVLIDRIDERAPLLRTLCLSNSWGGDPMNNKYTLPEMLFVGDDHRLERLELVNCVISWDSPLLHNLIHLKLHNTLQPTITQLLEALERMPLVETLDLKDSLPVMSNDNFGSPEIIRVIHLSRLSALSLSSTAIECAYLLNHISYPASTSLRLRCTLGVRSDCLPTLFKAISSVWDGRGGSQLLDTLIFQRDEDTTKLRGWTASGRENGGIRNDPAQMDVNLYYDVDERWDEETMIDICNALTLTHLRMLYIHSINPLPTSTWLNAFGSLTSLRAVCVYGRSAVGLVSALSTGLEGNSSEDILSNDGTGKVFLPCLQHLWLRESSDDMTTTFNSVKIFEDLRDCLMNRCHWNMEVRRLHLDCPRRYYKQLKLLREIVVDVFWEEVYDNEEVDNSESED